MADTGTRDATYDLISVAFHALQGVENCTKYEQDADEEELRSFFQEAQQRQRELADRAKSLLANRLS